MSDDSRIGPTAAHPVVLDVGGEGRHPGVWNLNPSRLRTFGPQRGEPIPRLIQARADAIPLADDSIDLVVAERTPLRTAALRELSRVTRPDGRIILRHVVTPAGDPHRFALQVLGEAVSRRLLKLGAHVAQESTFQPARPGQAELSVAPLD
jgi:ubiquinone/menaquinone biosynthesis C-methylase UbiE